MELRIGSPVFAEGRKVGRLAGFEVDATNRRVLRIVYSSDGRMGSHAMTRPVEAVSVEGRGLSVSRRLTKVPPIVPGFQPLVWSRITQVAIAGVPRGRLRGVDVSESGDLRHAIVGRGWWRRPERIAAAEVDALRGTQETTHAA